MTYDAAFITVESRVDNYRCTPTARIVFLCGNSYVARLADKIEDYPENERKYIRKAYNGGAVEIFNVAAIDEAPAGSVIYAVEGIFDALSLLQTGAEGVVAINGAPHWRKLVDRIKARSDGGKTLHVAILFDDDNAGQQAAENTKQALSRAHVPAIARFLPRAKTLPTKKMTRIGFYGLLAPMLFARLSFRRSSTSTMILPLSPLKLNITR